MKIIRTAQFSRVASDPLGPSHPMGHAPQPSIHDQEIPGGFEPAVSPQAAPQAPKQRPPFDEIAEVEPGEAIEDAISDLMIHVAGRYTTHENDGIGEYEHFGYKGFDAGSDRSFIEGLTIGVPLTGHEAEMNDDLIPHHVQGNASVNDPKNEMNAPLDIEWSAQFTGVVDFQGKKFAVYEVE